MSATELLSPQDVRRAHRSHVDRTTGVITMSQSALKVAAICETQSWLKMQGYTSKEEHAAATAGSAWHAARAVFNRGVGTPDAIAAAKATLEKEYKAFSDEHVDPNGPPWMQRLLYDNVAYIFGVWTERYVVDNDHILRIAQNGSALLRILPQYVEVYARAELSADDGLVLHGVLDGIVEEPTAGHWMVADDKTTGQLDARFVRQWDNDAQITLYTWLAEQHVIETGRRVLGGIIIATEIAKLPEPSMTLKGVETKCRVHHVGYSECKSWHVKTEFIPAERSEALVARFLKYAPRKMNRVRELILTSDPERALRMANVDGELNGGCERCFAKSWCIEGRKVGDLGTFAREDVGNGLATEAAA